MKINLKRVKELERTYCDSPVSINTLQEMISLVLRFQEAPMNLATNNVSMALETLKDLGVIVDESKISQLNS
jgi:hypothetical protein